MLVASHPAPTSKTMSLIIPIKTLQAHGVDISNVRHSEPKNYVERYVTKAEAAMWYFKTISLKTPEEVATNGLNPADRSEVNMKGDGDGFAAFTFGKRIAHKFIFAVPSKTQDGVASKALRNLGWLPGKAGDESYMYLFRMAEGDPYISPGGKFNEVSECAFPDWLVPTDFVAAYLFHFGDTVGAPLMYRPVRLTPAGG